MRISDWSSDVCSSDLGLRPALPSGDRGSMRIIFMGTPDFAVPVLAALVDAGHEIVAAYTQPPRREGRGQKLVPSPVEARATALGVAVRSPVSLTTADEQAALAGLDADAAGEAGRGACG